MQIAPELAGMFLGTPDPTRPTAEMNSDRLLYAGFPPALKSAMKAAAARHGWDREDWRLQTTLIAEAIRAGRASAHALAPHYAQAPEAP